MSILTIENHLNVNVALVSFTIAPSTFLAFAVLLFAYLYILHVRNNPKPRIEYRPDIQPHGDDRRVREPVRRPSLFGGLSGRLRPRKQRPEPVAPARLPFSSFWLPFRYGLRDGRVGVGRQIQSASMAPRRKRQSQQRLLE